jgi:hypothetical protein
MSSNTFFRRTFPTVSRPDTPDSLRLAFVPQVRPITLACMHFTPVGWQKDCTVQSLYDHLIEVKLAYLSLLHSGL